MFVTKILFYSFEEIEKELKSLDIYQHEFLNMIFEISEASDFEDGGEAVSGDVSIAGSNGVVLYDNNGLVISFKDSVVTINGLLGVQANELIYFESGVLGVALNLEYEIVKALVFGDAGSVNTAEWVSRSGFVMQVGVSSHILARMINPLGVAIDGSGEIDFEEFKPIEKKAPGVINRKKMVESLETGMKVVDSLVPIGRGQRELILGDSKTGKTTVAIDTILNQSASKGKFRIPVVCVYVAVGKRMSEIVRISKLLSDKGAYLNTALVVASASDPASLQFIAPYSACTMAEYFTYKGYHSLIVYDDLTRHADAYRQISLLLRRPVGSEAYPGDIFYLHSRLLERAVKLSMTFGGGSLTALPMVETVQGDVSAYIPTNVISITDGQIYLDLGKHQEGIRPAVDPGISVSRVGSSAQASLMKRLAGTLKLELAQYREVEQFSKFGSELDPATRSLLFKGKMMVSLLTQSRNKPMFIANQLLLFHVVSTDFFVNVVSKEVSISDVEYTKSLQMFAMYAFLFLPTKVAWEKSVVLDRDMLDIMVQVHYMYYVHEDHIWSVNRNNVEVLVLVANFGSVITDLLLLAKMTCTFRFRK